jgi:hypothetical protein
MSALGLNEHVVPPMPVHRKKPLQKVPKMHNSRCIQFPKNNGEMSTIKPLGVDKPGAKQLVGTTGSNSDVGSRLREMAMAKQDLDMMSAWWKTMGAVLAFQPCRARWV